MAISYLGTEEFRKEVRETVASRLKRIREHLGMTVEEFAVYVSVDEDRIRSFEEGTSVMYADELYNIVTATDVSSDYICGLIDYMFPDKQKNE